MSEQNNELIAEKERLNERNEGREAWSEWGPYVSERQWGTVREDYGEQQEPWNYFPFNHSHMRAYRWGEDGIGGISDIHQYLCFGLSLWNEKDKIIKERLFGLSNSQGNHGEDVKELYYHLDNTPTHSYMKYLYKYPQAGFPYDDLINENGRRSKSDPEYELHDTSVFNDNRYFDVYIDYAKASPEDWLITITVENRGPDEAPIHIIPTLWFRNTWAWGYEGEERPSISVVQGDDARAPYLKAQHQAMHDWQLHFQHDEAPELLFTENETNYERIFENRTNQSDYETEYAKDGINNYVVNGEDSINPDQVGTKAGLRYKRTIPAGQKAQIRLRLSSEQMPEDPTGDGFEKLTNLRRKEADEFYEDLAPDGLSDDAKNVQRQSLSGMLWNKQFYHYNVRKWLLGDPAQPEPPKNRKEGRNSNWTHLDNKAIISMPDGWEYPWYAVWDLAFHCLPLAIVDTQFAKDQLVLMLHEWYMHPNGQIPSYEWDFGDATPPVHAWAALRVFRIDKKQSGEGDYNFLRKVFHKLLLNFTWWVNRKDEDGRNVFQGGFLGLDNIGLFDRSVDLPGEARLDQSDGTSWMAMFCLNMLSIALELAAQDDSYEDVAIKFLEHFFYIAHAINERGEASISDEMDFDLWDSDDKFYYDVLHTADGEKIDLKIRSMVGLIPLFAVTTIDSSVLDHLPEFNERLNYLLKNRPDLTQHIASVTRKGAEEHQMFSVVNKERLISLLQRTFDEDEFLSPYGIRSLSKFHKEHPYSLKLGDTTYEITYRPAESQSNMYGGNSNWRGPVWFPLNYLLIESLQKFDYYYGDSLTIEFPTHSGTQMPLWNIAAQLSQRLMSIFLKDDEGNRAVYGGIDKFQNDPHFKDNILFFEYFHGDNGYGLGANHQNGWTGLVAKLIQQSKTNSMVSSFSLWHNNDTD